MIDESAGAVVSVVVHKAGPASGWIGHNLLLRARRFLLRPNISSSSAASSSTSVANASGVRFAFQSSGNDANHFSASSSTSDLLLRCCEAVYSASFDPTSITVVGSIPERLVPSAANVFHPSLFRWSHIGAMSDSDCSQILGQVFGKGGILSKRDEPDVIPEIKFERSLSAAHTPKISERTSDDGLRHAAATITGNLCVAGKTNLITCNAFLVTSSSLLSGNEKHAVFQCPVDTRKWEIPVASCFGLLTTEPEVIVEVAVPVNKLLVS